MPADYYYVNQYTKMPFVNSELLQSASYYLNISSKMFCPTSITAETIKTRIKARNMHNHDNETAFIFTSCTTCTCSSTSLLLVVVIAVSLAMFTFSPIGLLSSNGLRIYMCVCLCVYTGIKQNELLCRYASVV